MNVISTQSLAEQHGPKCRVCDDPPHIAFNWQYAQQNTNHNLHVLASHLKQVKVLKFGQLFACRLCGSQWVLDDGLQTATRVPSERLNILQAWNEQRLVIPSEQLRALDAIGGTAPNFWMGRSGVIQIPCAITLLTGERIDPALVWITKRPPIDMFTSRLMLFQPVDKVEPSPFALPLNVRRVTVTAPEISMGFSPTRVEALDGRPFVLHWATSLFDRDGVKGSEIRLSAKGCTRGDPAPVAEADSTYATYVVADWFEGAERLDKTRAGGRPGSLLRAWWKRLF